MVPVIGWFERFAERVSGSAGLGLDAVRPAIISLVTAVFGLCWVLSLHVDVGRDTGPSGTPAHYFILAGLFGIVMRASSRCACPRARGATFVKIRRDWHAPLGGILMFAAGSFSLIGFRSTTAGTGSSAGNVTLSRDTQTSC
jgi:hypothetical protein